MKIIHTNLLKRGHNSDVGKATASHMDYCKYCYYSLKDDYSFKNYMAVFNEFIERFIFLILVPFVRLTKGIILYPLWISVHLFHIKETIKRYGSIDKLNDKAKEVLERIDEQSEYDKEIF